MRACVLQSRPTGSAWRVWLQSPKVRFYGFLQNRKTASADFRKVSVRRTHLPNSSIKGDGVRVFLSGRDHPYRQDFHAPTKLLPETVVGPTRPGAQRIGHGQSPRLQPETLGSADALSGRWGCAHRHNQVENQIRPWALGRSNWLFAGSLRSGKRAAAIMSLVQSARMNGHDPYAYLKDVLTLLPMQLASEITDLLPHKWVNSLG